LFFEMKMRDSIEFWATSASVEADAQRFWVILMNAAQQRGGAVPNATGM
jgi:hypothetical protein